MPRRSPRYHVSTRAADIEIAARITAIYIRDIEDGSNVINAGSGSRAQSPDRQPHHHRIKLRVPSPGTARPDDLSNVPHGAGNPLHGIAGALHLQGGVKATKKKRGPHHEEARKESHNFILQSRNPKTTPYRWSPDGPTAQDNQALPIRWQEI